MLKVLIVDKMHKSLLAMLEQAQFEANYQPAIKREEIKKIIKGYDGLIIRSKTYVDEDLLRKTTKIKFVARAGSGLDNLDVDYLNSKKIILFNAPEGN